MSSIMRRRRGLISAIGNLLSEGLGTKNPGSFQTGGDCDRPLTAAQAASFNPLRVSYSAAWYKIIPFLHALRAMSAALEEVCRMLKVDRDQGTREVVPWQRTVARRRGRNGRVDAMELGGLDVPLAVLVLGA